jgi:hypothetical protein
MGRKSRYIWLTLALMIFGGKTFGDTLPQPWSQLIRSQDGRYIFAMISPYQQELADYARRQREFMRVQNRRGEDPTLRGEMERERRIRAKYPASGLYTAGNNPKLLWKLDFYDVLGWRAIYVSNDGIHLVFHRAEFFGHFVKGPTATNSSDGDYLPDGEQTVLNFYSMGQLLATYRASELTPMSNLQRGLNDFFVWSDQGRLDEKKHQFTFARRDGDNLTFDITTGKLVSGDTPTAISVANVNTPQQSQTQESRTCFGGALIVSMLIFCNYGSTWSIRIRNGIKNQLA